jgi:hypothetical protein
VDVLDDDRGHVHEDADGQGQAAQGHDVHSLAGNPQRRRRAHQRQRNVQHDDQSATPVAQKQQDHQPREQRAQRAFQSQAGNRTRDVRRLVEFVTNLHVAGDDALKFGQVGFD